MGKNRRQRRVSPKKQDSVWGGYVDWTVDSGGRLVAVDELAHRLAIQQPHGGFKFLGRKGNGPGQFHYPRSIEISDAVAYVVDSWNHRVQIFELPDWKIVETFGGGGDGPGQFFCPSWITVVDREDELSWLVIADTNNRRLSFHDAAGKYLFSTDPFDRRFPSKVRACNETIEVQFEGGQWETVF